MNFLYPGFLFALLAVAIPILIHLFNFRKFKKVYFSNVQFLKEASEQHSSREKLKNILILISRMLAITFLVLAFARPYLFSGEGLQNSGVNHQVNIYIDNSYSMESTNSDGSLLDEAKRKAKEIVSSYGINDQFRLLTNDFEARNQRYVDQEEFKDLLEEVKISPVSRTLQQVVSRLQNHNSQHNSALYLISDFQKDFAGVKPLKVDSTAQFTLVKLAGGGTPNVAVDSVWFLSPTHQPGAAEKLVLRLRNYSDKEIAAVPLKLSVNQQQKAMANVKIGAGGSVTDTLSFAGLRPGWQKGVLTLKDFPLVFDDVFHFSFEVRSQLKVLNIKGQDAGNYITAVFGADRYFSLVEMPETNIKYSAFSEYGLIVLSGLKTPSSGLSQQLKTFVVNGGSVVIFPDLATDIGAYNTFLKSLSLPSVHSLVEGEPLVSKIDLSHPLFKDVFEEVPRNLDLPLVKRYFNYTNQATSGRQTILSLPLNRSLFSQYRLGDGQVYLSASSLKPEDNSLPAHAVFLPLMYKIAFSAARERPLYYTLGRDEAIDHEKLLLDKNQTLKLVAEDLEILPEIRQVPGRTLLYIADQVKAAGFYELRKTDSLMAVVAFNDNRLESNMRYADEKQLKSLFGKNLRTMLEGKDAAKKIEMRNNPTELWKLCLILTAVFLAVEILLIRFFNHSKNLLST